MQVAGGFGQRIVVGPLLRHGGEVDVVAEQVGQCCMPQVVDRPRALDALPVGDAAGFGDPFVDCPQPVVAAGEGVGRGAEPVRPAFVQDGDDRRHVEPPFLARLAREQALRGAGDVAPRCLTPKSCRSSRWSDWRHVSPSSIRGMNTSGCRRVTARAVAGAAIWRWIVLRRRASVTPNAVTARAVMPQGVCKPGFELEHTCAGWKQLLYDCHQELIAIDAGYEFGYATEKFGLLSLLVLPGVGFTGEPHYETQYEALRAICKKFERYALGVCQYCGAPGEHRSWDGWYAVQCASCARKSVTEKIPL